jgi:hypothetical protein
MTKIILPFYDKDGKLSPILNESIKNGATAENYPDNQDLIIVTLKKGDKNATALKAYEVTVETDEAADVASEAPEAAPEVKADEDLSS